MSTKKKLSPSILIRTKFSPPRLTRSPVPREGVLRLLSTGLIRPLTLIKAPAGFGKTTLLTLWREALLVDGQIVAWLTLDQDDNDENRFVDYLTAALTEALGVLADETVEQRIAGKMVSVKIQLTSIINMLDNLGREVILMLDDYDKLTDPAVLAHMAFLLEHIPANLHVIAACRANPALNVALLRVRNQLLEIDTDALRFGVEETHTFFANSASVDLSADEIRAVHEATEGWVAGMQIATLAMPGRVSLNGLISSFPQHSKALSDYLSQNVLTRIPPETIEFMLRTAIVDRLNGTLCEHITGSSGAEEKLEWLVSQNMFLQPLDEDGHWYRYHALFADFLRAQLKRRMPDEIATLHLRAAEWYAEHALWAEAVRHAIDAGHADLAADWLEQCVLGELKNSRVLTFRGWIQKLPPDILRQRPSLRIALIWALILTMRPLEAQALVAEVDAQLREESFPNNEELRRTLRAQCVSIFATQDDISSALELGKQVWAERFPDGKRPERKFDWEDEAFLNVMIHLYRKVGDIASARRVSEFYQLDDEGSRNLFMLSYRAILVAALNVHDGQLRAGARYLEETLELCEQQIGRRSAAASLLAASLAGIYYDWNRLEAVEDLLADRFDIIDDVCWLEPIQSAYISLVRIRMAQGALEAAHGLLTKCEALADQRGWPRLLAACSAERVRLWLAGDEPSAAERVLNKLNGTANSFSESRPEDDSVICMVLGTRARLLIHTGRFEEAEALLESALASTQYSRGVMPCDLAQLSILLAVAHHGTGKSEAAQARLSEVLLVTENDGTIRPLVDAGAMIIPILWALKNPDGGMPPGDYYRNLYQALGIQPGNAEGKRGIVSINQESAAANGILSSRESDVLELVSQKLSNKQIARKLFITPETVKWHLKKIYRKLGVSGRQLAAQRGRQMPTDATN